jgi:uncharacterized protein (DUF305 family)
MFHRLALSGALAGVLLLSACGGDSTDTTANSTTGGDAGSSSSTTDKADFNDADVAFVTGMTPHHAQAVEMSDLVLDSDPSAEVAALAERIKAAQTPEIAELEEMLEHFGAEDVSGGGHGGDHGGDAAGHGGMMSEQDLQALDDATGPDASRLYLEAMLAHHRGAIEAAETELAEGTYADALDLAERIKADQAAEITEMEQLLTQL